MEKLIIIKEGDLQRLIEDGLRKVQGETAHTPPTHPPQKSMLTIDEACDFLSLSKPAIYARTSSRRIPFNKIGKKLYFKRSELLIWIECNGDMRVTRKRIKELTNAQKKRS